MTCSPHVLLLVTNASSLPSSPRENPPEIKMLVLLKPNFSACQNWLRDLPHLTPPLLTSLMMPRELYLLPELSVKGLTMLQNCWHAMRETLWSTLSSHPTLVLSTGPSSHPRTHSPPKSTPSLLVTRSTLATLYQMDSLTPCLPLNHQICPTSTPPPPSRLYPLTTPPSERSVPQASRYLQFPQEKLQKFSTA